MAFEKRVFGRAAHGQSAFGELFGCGEKVRRAAGAVSTGGLGIGHPYRVRNLTGSAFNDTLNGSSGVKSPIGGQLLMLRIALAYRSLQ